MSDPIIKGVKRSPSRPAASRHSSTSRSSKNRTVAAKPARPKPIATRAATKKAPAQKAAKVSKSAASASAKGKAKTAAARKAPNAKPAQSARSSKSVARKPAPVKPQKKQSAAAPAKKSAPAKAQTSKQNVQAAPARRPAVPPPPRKPSVDEAAALKAFERAHKEFARGRFTEARNLFRDLLEKHAGVSEVSARARTYLNIAEQRLRTEPALPRDADSLYDRGVIELNRGEYVAAQELFERALKREPEAPHIHYGLAASRARLGSVDSALESLQKALSLQATLRIRAQHDQDLLALRNDPEFERLVFTSRA